MSSGAWVIVFAVCMVIALLFAGAAIIGIFTAFLP
jgi:hypothetical protein